MPIIGDATIKARGPTLSNTALSPYPVSLSSLFDRVEALFKQAEVAIHKQQFDLACYFFQAAHSKDPENIALIFSEAQLWQQGSQLFELSHLFTKAYRCYKQCFTDEEFGMLATWAAVELKFDQFELCGTINAIAEAEHLIDTLPSSPDKDFLKAQALYYQGLYYQEPLKLNEALELLKKLHAANRSAKYANLIADIYTKLQELTQELGCLITAISYRKEALELDSTHINVISSLAQDYRNLFFLTLDESQIEEFNETSLLATLFKPHDTSLYLQWAEGLIDMGIAADKVDWVKLGIEKSHEALKRTASHVTIDLLIARGLCFLGKKLDQLGPIQDAYEKIKDIEEDPANKRLLITTYDILIAFGSYFQDIDYHYQAIERLQEALSLNSSQRHYWYLMAQAYLEVSNVDHNPQTIELALRMINKALNFYRCPQTLILKASILIRLGEIKQSSELFEDAQAHFDVALSIYPGLFQPKLTHLFEQARVLDICANIHEDEGLYLKALEQLTHIILVDPHFPGIHHQIALTQFHLGELTLNLELIKKSLVHFKLAANQASDEVLVDWAIACLTLSEMVETRHEAIFLQHETANKLKKALKQGQLHAFYFMACLSTVCHDYDKALTFLKIAERHEVLPSPEEISQDEWLIPLHHNIEFIKLIERQEIRRS